VNWLAWYRCAGPGGWPPPKSRSPRDPPSKADSQWGAQTDGRQLGYRSAQKINTELLDSHPLTYQGGGNCDRFTTTHAPDGSLYQLVGVSSHPALGDNVSAPNWS